MNATSTATAQPPGQAMEFLGQIAYHAYLMKPLFPTYLHLLVSAIFPIYTASHAALSRPPSAAPKKRAKDGKTKNDEEDEDEVGQKIESLTPSDAILFPLLAGTVLASLYFILKWLQDPAWLNWALGIYFSQIGLFFTFRFVRDTLATIRSYVFPKQYSSKGQLWVADSDQHIFISQTGEKRSSPVVGPLRILPLGRQLTSKVWTWRKFIYTKATLQIRIRNLVDFKTLIDVQDLASLLIAVSVVAYHQFIDKPWYLTNFLGFSFCYGSLQFMSPTTAWTGTLVLSALFFYDIYFVFFTPMMVTVATKLDVPIKLLFPKPDGCVFPIGALEGSKVMEEYLQCLAKKKTMAMLGLGDIVVPGMIMAFALRFDLYLFYLRQTPKSSTNDIQKPKYLPATGAWGERFWTKTKLQPRELQAKRFSKVYFYATVVGYLGGMIITVLVMQVWQHAQPALLYLVPGVLGSFWGTALVRREVKLLWRYTEMPEDEEVPKLGDKDQQKKLEALQQDTKSQIGEDDRPPTDTNMDTDTKATAEESSTDTTKFKAKDKSNIFKRSSTTKQSTSPESRSRSSNELFHLSITLIDSMSTTISPTAKNDTTSPIKSLEYEQNNNLTITKPFRNGKKDKKGDTDDRNNDEDDNDEDDNDKDDEDDEDEKGETIEVAPDKKTRSTSKNTKISRDEGVDMDRADGEPVVKRRRRL